VVVRSDPPGAHVVIDGRDQGSTPTILSLALPHEILLRLDGYRDTREIITRAGEFTVALTRKRGERSKAEPVAAPAPSPKPAPVAKPKGEGLD
jgi:hypothetical protein